ncbi:MAG TPA: nucleotide exchange factor GrpE [Candidatus Saccharimonadales bacterium]|nr:nucleotide exchange factor GrpE [Candidatus Saccharimonadales bacterium]
MTKQKDPNDEQLEAEEETTATDDSEVVDELEELKQQIGDFENKYRRALADYQNLQKRTQEEKGEWIRSANRDLLLRILTVLDTLMLAQQHTQDKNIQVTVQQFLDVLKSEGAVKIDAVGKKFDPNTMEAIATDAGEEGIVLEELRIGFMMNDKLLRAAQVKVGKE